MKMNIPEYVKIELINIIALRERLINIDVNEIISTYFNSDYLNTAFWHSISYKEKLSEEFILFFKNELDLNLVSAYQKLSETFIKNNKQIIHFGNFPYQNNLLHFENIIVYQNLSDELFYEFILNFNKLDPFYQSSIWQSISLFKKLSEPLIREFKDKVNWHNITISQTLSNQFLQEFSNRIDIELYKQSHESRTKEQIVNSICQYAKLTRLNFDGQFLYAYRNHDQWGRGMYNKTIFYEKGKYYRDWHCDMRQIACSFGLGICSKGNTPVKVSVDDWGIFIPPSSLSLSNTFIPCRVWGFTVI